MEKSFYRCRLNKKETHIQFGDDDCVCIGGLNKKETHIQFGDDDCVCIGGFLELDYGD
jgi:hypothetical protein